MTETAVRPSFNLLEEAWIPALDLEGQLEEFSLLELLDRCKELGAIVHEDPLVVVALHRLALAFLHRALDGPRDAKEAAAWLKDGFPQETIREYAEVWRDRFDLFDSKFPFGQHPELENEKFVDHWSRLQAARGSFNTNFLYSYELRDKTDNEDAVGAAEACRQLLAHQHFALGGLTKRFVTSAKASPYATSCLTLVMGENLQETLCLNLVGYDRKHNREADKASWELEPPKREELKEGLEKPVNGLAQSYTWEARSVRFEADAKGEVTRMYYAEGLSPGDAGYRDPMVTLTRNSKGELYPLGYREGRGLWRDLHSFVPSADDNSAPQVAEWANGLLLQARRYDQALHFGIFGIVNNKAKISTVRHEELRLPPLVSNAPEIKETLQNWAGAAQENNYELNLALRALASNLLTKKRNGAATRDVSALLESFQSDALYWPEAERLFWQHLDTLPVKANDYYARAEEFDEQWLKKLTKLKLKVFDAVGRSLEPTPETLRAISKARAVLWKGRKKK